MVSQTSIASRRSVFEGPNRGCTDWPCLLLFVVFLVVYVVFAIFVFREGSLNRFLFPTDSHGRICGADGQVDRQYLQFFDIIKCVKYVFVGARCPTPQICVPKCPSTFYHYKLLYAQELKLTNDREDRIRQIRSQLSCEESARSQVYDPRLSIYTLVKERKVCAPYAFPSIDFYGRCIPSILVRALNATIKQANDVIQNNGGNTTDDDVIPNKDLMQKSLEYFKKALQIKRLLSFMMDDLVRSRYVLLLSLLVAMVILVVYMLLLRYLARWMMWISLLSCIAVFALAAVFSFTARARLKTYDSHNNTLPDLHEMNFTFNLNGSSREEINSTVHAAATDGKGSAIEKFDTAMILLDQFAPMSVVWLVLGIFCCIVCAVLITCLCCLCDRLSLAAALIEEASRAICHALTILIWPVITFLVNIAIVILAVLAMAYYSTLGQPIYEISCSQDFGQSCQVESSRAHVISNGSEKQQAFRSPPKSCFDYNEGDPCSMDEFAQLNCTTDRIGCVFVSFGFLDETFTPYFDSVWSHRLADFLSRRSWVVNLFNIFMTYWLLAFTVATEEMILACTFAAYYWNIHEFDEKCCRSYFNRCLCLRGVSLTCRHHLGTIALGSSIIAIIDTLRAVIDLLKDRIEAVNLGNYGQCFVRLIDGFLACIRCCSQFFSRYTYIMTAISGKWFCRSAFTATRLLLANCLRVFVLDRVCAILLYIGRLTITIGACVVTAYILDRMDESISLHFSWFPVLIVGIVVYISSAVFLNVYSTATSTLFFCVLYDVDDDSTTKPYATYNRLKKILRKSNDFTDEKFQDADARSPNDQAQSQF